MCVESYLNTVIKLMRIRSKNYDQYSMSVFKGTNRSTKIELSVTATYNFLRTETKIFTIAILGTLFSKNRLQMAIAKAIRTSGRKKIPILAIRH